MSSKQLSREPFFHESEWMRMYSPWFHHNFLSGVGCAVPQGRQWSWQNLPKQQVLGGRVTSVSLGLSQIIAFSRPLNETWHLQLTPVRWARCPSLPWCEQMIKPVGTVPGMMGWGLERQQEAAQVVHLSPTQRWVNMKSYGCIYRPVLSHLGRACEKAVRNFGEQKERVGLCSLVRRWRFGTWALASSGAQPNTARVLTCIFLDGAWNCSELIIFRASVF